MRCLKSGSKEVHDNTGLLQERRKISNWQFNFMSKEITKIRKNKA